MSEGSPCAFLDASVIYPASLRDLLMRLTLSGLFRARWSNQVHEEWTGALLRNRPDLTAEKLHRVRAAMNRHAEDAIVAGFEDLIPSLDLPDPNDRHVLAAAIAAGAETIVTSNLKDFPIETLARHDMTRMHPDRFLQHLLTLEPVIFLETVENQRADMETPPVSMDDLLGRFEKLNLSVTVSELRRLLASR